MVVNSLEELSSVAEIFLKKFPEPRVVRVEGAMGAGKTTFIKAICRALGIKEEVSSPTFGFVNEYLTQKGNKVFHFDFYRIERPEEALDFGMEEYLASPNSWCFLEWAERIEEYLPEDYLTIQISENEEIRDISF